MSAEKGRTMEAMFIKADDAVAVERRSIETKFTLTELQAAVGGYVRLLGLNGGAPVAAGAWRLMIVNEDGMPLKLPVNVRATNLAGQIIVGDVLVLDHDID